MCSEVSNRIQTAAENAILQPVNNNLNNNNWLFEDNQEGNLNELLFQLDIKEIEERENAQRALEVKIQDEDYAIGRCQDAYNEILKDISKFLEKNPSDRSEIINLFKKAANLCKDTKFISDEKEFYKKENKKLIENLLQNVKTLMEKIILDQKLFENQEKEKSAYTALNNLKSTLQTPFAEQQSLVNIAFKELDSEEKETPNQHLEHFDEQDLAADFVGTRLLDLARQLATKTRSAREYYVQSKTTIGNPAFCTTNAGVDAGGH